MPDHTPKAKAANTASKRSNILPKTKKKSARRKFLSNSASK